MHTGATRDAYGSETRLPVIPKSYHKINSGPFVQTPHGLRLLRMPEIERIHGHHLGTEDYATGVEMLGQGVQSGLFRTIFRQLGVQVLGAPVLRYPE